MYSLQISLHKSTNSSRVQFPIHLPSLLLLLLFFFFFSVSVCIQWPALQRVGNHNSFLLEIVA